jgi:hypothetical protein
MQISSTSKQTVQAQAKTQASVTFLDMMRERKSIPFYYNERYGIVKEMGNQNRTFSLQGK